MRYANNRLMQKNVLLLCCVLLVVLFVYTGVAKLADLSSFRNDLNGQVFPPGWVRGLVYLLPALEILVAISICFDRSRLLGLWAASVLMFLFTLYAALVLAGVFKRIPCSCGGVIRRLSWQQHFWFNTCFLAVSIVSIKLCIHTNRGNRKPAEKSR